MIKDKKIKDVSGFVKREASIINTDSQEYQDAKARLEKVKREEENLNKTKELEQKVESLSQKMDLILTLLEARSK